MKTLTKELRKTHPENIKVEVIYTGTKLGYQFNIKDPTPKRYNHNVIFHTVLPQANCNEDYIGGCSRRLRERTKGHNGRDKNSNVFGHSI